MQSARRVLLPTLLALGTACGATAESALGPPATLALTTAPDLTGTVARADAENAVGPEGPYSQVDVWLTVPPATAANAGVVVPLKTPVFVRGRGGAVTAAAPGDIRAGDAVEVWHDQVVGYGAVQGPPGAPTYFGTQVVIDR